MAIEQLFMLEIFAGAAVLTAVAKQAGFASSIAIDKVRKAGARSTIFQLDLTVPRDRALLEQWLASDLIAWVHLAPVCGTASKARNIRRFAGDLQPLRSSEHPEGIPGLSQRDSQRVAIATDLFLMPASFFICVAQRAFW